MIFIIKIKKHLKDGRKAITPFLYLRARNIDRDIVDLLEITDMFNCINDIIECFPDEFENAKNKTCLDSENINGLKLSIK